MPENQEEAMNQVMAEMSIALSDDTVPAEVTQEQIRQSWAYHMWLAGIEEGPFSS